MGKRRAPMTSHTIRELEEIYKTNPHPERSVYLALAKQFNFSESTMYRWFWVRRKKEESMRRKQYAEKRATALNQQKPDLLKSSRSAFLSVTQNTLQSPKTSNQVVLNEGQIPIGQGNSAILPRQLAASNVTNQTRPVHEEVQALQRPCRERGRFTNRKRVAKLLGVLSNKQVTVLEKLYQQVPNPSREDISRLASRFVREQDKEEEIREWFAKRRSCFGEQFSDNFQGLNDEECRNNSEFHIVNGHPADRSESIPHEMELHVSPDSVYIPDELPTSSVGNSQTSPHENSDVNMSEEEFRKDEIEAGGNATTHNQVVESSETQAINKLSVIESRTSNGPPVPLALHCRNTAVTNSSHFQDNSCIPHSLYEQSSPLQDFTANRRIGFDYSKCAYSLDGNNPCDKLKSFPVVGKTELATETPFNGNEIFNAINFEIESTKT